MAGIGSVFLGDHAQRIRPLSQRSGSTATPPSSPPPTGVPGIMYTGRSTTSPLARILDDAEALSPSKGKFVSEARALPKHIDPRLALELRVRWLEAIVYGTKPQDSSAGGPSASRPGLGRPQAPAKGKQKETLKDGETLVRLAENVQNRLNEAVESNDGLKKFMNHYEQHAQYLTPAFALSGVMPEDDTASSMTPEEIDAYLTELEPDLRAADRDLQEIEVLLKKGVTGSGKLPDHEHLRPRLDALITENKADMDLAASLERRIALVMRKHAKSVDALSELFVAWDDALTVTEDSIAKMEKEKRERRRLGLD
ncbi:hypothetical protein BKA70DRAFT_476541 [Coprinopsis sp. MPI-PUGE-AT-0042]|nr:hypothetical protein BKA70DRAFT_476541 [Coprinopsis sp. MPI-PUGE-AT-0042]